MSEGTKRRLAAIVSADVVGYSRLIGADEAGTLDALRMHRAELIDPMIGQQGGRIVKTMGDGLLLEFPSVVAAVECCIGVQEGMAMRNGEIAETTAIRFRVGVHLGDIVVEGDDIFGDGVNIAARLQEIGEAGGIAISGTAHENITGRIEAGFADIGEQTLKNIERPIRVWRWKPEDRGSTAVEAETVSLVLPDKPSIAVLPFDNMSGDPEQEYFADGIAEDVITALSRFSSLFVIARNSSFTYKGRSVDLTVVGRELGVRYVVEGSVRKSGNRVRITAQLIDATSGNHLWADRFDGNIDDVFDLQDRITEQIVIAVEPEIGSRERERARRKSPDSLGAWELLQRGLMHLYRFNKVDRAEAERLFREAAKVDPNFAAAHANLAFVQSALIRIAAADDREIAVNEARAAANEAISLNPDEPLAHYCLGRLYIVDGDVEMAIAEMQASIANNPNFARGHQGLGYAYYHGAGELDRALLSLDTALRLSPRDPMRWLPLFLKGSVLRDLGRYDDAVSHCRQACQLPHIGYLPQYHLAAALAEAGKLSQARTAMEKAIQIEPALSIGFIRDSFINLHETVLENLLNSMRKAGFPE